MTMFTFSIFNWKIWSKKSKLSVLAKIWSLHLLEYPEFNGGVRFLCFWPEISFLSKFGPKIQNCQFKLKFGTETNSNKQNSMVLFTFSVFNRKYPFWVSLVQKLKIVSFSWNLVPGLIRICKIQWWYSFFFRPEIPFLGKFGPKNQNCQFKLKSDT